MSIPRGGTGGEFAGNGGGGGEKSTGAGPDGKRQPATWLAENSGAEYSIKKTRRTAGLFGEAGMIPGGQLIFQSVSTQPFESV